MTNNNSLSARITEHYSSLSDGNRRIADFLQVNPEKILMLSTSDTPDTAASPTLETMTVSIMPTATANTCSISNGTTNFLKSSFEKSIITSYSLSSADMIINISICIIANCMMK